MRAFFASSGIHFLNEVLTPIDAEKLPLKEEIYFPITKQKGK